MPEKPNIFNSSNSSGSIKPEVFRGNPVDPKFLESSRFNIPIQYESGSQYDIGILPFMNQEDYRHNSQSKWDIVGNSLAHLGGSALSTALEIPAIAYGIIKAPFVGINSLAHGKGFIQSEADAFNQYYDNELSRGVVDPIQNWFNTAFKVYQSQEQENSNFFSAKNLFSGTTLDMIASGAGYTIGSFLTGAALTKVFGLAKLAAIGAKAPKAEELMNAGEKAAKEALSLDAKRELYIGGIMGWMEASQQTRQDKDALIQKLTKDHPELGKQGIKDIANTHSLTSFAFNMGLLTGSNVLLLKNFFRPGASTVLESETAINKGVEIGENLEAQIKKPLNKYLNFGKKALINPITKGFGIEGGQEGLQFAYGQALNEYTEKRLDPNNKNNFALDLLTSGIDGISDMLFTKEGQENWFTGGIIGAFSGIGGAVRGNNTKERDEHNKKLIQWVNSNLPQFSEVLKDRLLDANRTFTYTENANKNLANKDKFNYYNDKHSAFVSFVQQYIDRGSTDLLKTQIESLSKLSPEELNKVFGNDVTQKDLNRWDAKETTKSLIDEINKIQNTHEKVKQLIPNPFNQETDLSNYIAFRGLQKIFTHTASTIDNSKQRIEKLNTDLFNLGAVPFDINSYTDLNKEEKDKYLKEYQEDIEKNTNPVNHKQILENAQDIINLSQRLQDFKDAYSELGKVKNTKEKIEEIKKQNQTNLSKDKIKTKTNVKEEVKNNNENDLKEFKADTVIQKPGSENIFVKKQDNGTFIDKDNKVYSEKEGWFEAGKTNIHKGVKEELHGIVHFKRLFKFGLTRGDSEAIKANEILQKLAVLPNWRKFTKVIVNKSRVNINLKNPEIISKELQDKPKELRQRVNTEIDILLELTDPKTGETSAYFHPYNPYFYELNNEVVDFNNITYEEFNKYFSNKNQIPFSESEFEIIKSNWNSLKEFFNKAKDLFEQQDKEEIELDSSDIEFILSGEADFTDKAIDLNSEKFGDIFKSSPIISNDSKDESINEFPIPQFNTKGNNNTKVSSHPSRDLENENLQDYKYGRAFHALALLDNGFSRWIRILPKHIEPNEVISRLRIALEKINKLDKEDNTKPKIHEILNELSIFVSRKAGVNLFFDGIGNTFQIFYNDKKTGKKENREITSEQLTDFETLIKYINSVFNLESPMNENSFRESLINKDGNTKKLSINDFETYISPNIIKNWTLLFNLDTKDISQKLENPLNKEIISEVIDKKAALEDKKEEFKFTERELKIIDSLPEEEREEQRQVYINFYKLKAQKEREDLEDNNEINPLTKTKLVQSEEEIQGSITYEEAKKILYEQLPDWMKTTNTLDTVFRNLKTNGRILSAFLDDCIYISNLARKEDIDHEVFHGVFGAILSPDEQRRYLSTQRNRLKLSNDDLQSKVNNILNTRPDIVKALRQGIIDKTWIQNLVFEESLSDEYSEFRKNKKLDNKPEWLKKIFELFNKFIEWVTGNANVQSLFEKIDSGGFRNSSKNTFSKIGLSKTKLVEGLGSIESLNLINTIAARVYEDGISIEEVIDQMIAELLPENNKAEIKSSNTPNELKSYLKWQLSVISAEANQEIIQSEVSKVLKRINYDESEIDQNEFDTNEQSDERDTKEFNILNTEYNPANKVSKTIKSWISTVQYTKNIFGKDFKIAVDFNSLYTKLLKNLSSSADIMDTLEELSKGNYNPDVSALYNRLISKTGYTKESPSGIGIRGQRFLQLFKKQFELRPSTFVNTEINSSSFKNHVFNKAEAGRAEFNSWSNLFSSEVVSKLRDKDYIFELKTDFDYLADKLNSKNTSSWSKDKTPLNELVDSILSKVGITLNENYLKAIYSKDFNPELLSTGIIKAEDIRKLHDAIFINLINPFTDDTLYNLKQRLLEIAEGSSKFDSLFILTNARSTDGSLRHSFTERNYYSDKILELKDTYSKEVNIPVLGSSWESYNPLLTQSPDVVSINFQNLILGDFVDVNLTGRKGKGYTNSSENELLGVFLAGVQAKTKVSGKSDGIDYLKEYGFIPPSSIADKRSFYMSFLPIKDYYTPGIKGSPGGISKLAEKDLKNLFIQEFRLLNGDFGEYNKNLDIFIIFPELNDHQELIKKIREDSNNIDKYWNEVFEVIKTQIKEEIQELQEKSSEAKYNFNIDELSNIYLNDFISSEGINQLVSGKIRDLNPSKAKKAKTWEDKYNAVKDEWFKRQAGINAAGQNMGVGDDIIQYVQSDIMYMNTINSSIISKEDFEKLNSDEKKNYTDVDSDDSQEDNLIETLIKDKNELGTLFLYTDPKTKEVFDEEILLNKLAGNVLDDKGNPIPLTNRERGMLDLIPQKHTVRGQDNLGNEIYNKMSIRYLSPWDFGTWNSNKKQWEPKENREKGFYRWKHMKDNNIDRLIVNTESKMFTPKELLDPNKFHEDQKVQKYSSPRRFRREQQKSKSKSSNTVPLSVQLQQMVHIGLLDNEKNTIIKNAFNTLSANVRALGFEVQDNYFNSDGELRKDLSIILEKFRENLENTIPDAQKIELAQDIKGALKYTFNLSHISNKFEEIYLSHFEPGFKIKLKGAQPVLMSSNLFPVLRNKETGEIITQDEIDSNPKEYKSDKYIKGNLRTMFEAGTSRENNHAEIILSKFTLNKLGIRVGDFVIFNRTPLQEYGFMGVAKIVDSLPEYWGDTVLGAPQLVKYMGTDFDFDKLFVYSKERYEEGYYGDSTTQEDKFNEYKNWLFENNRDLKKSLIETLKENGYSEVIKEIKEFVLQRKDIKILLDSEDDPYEYLWKITNRELKELLKDRYDDLKDIRDISERKVLEKYSLPSTLSEYISNGSPKSQGELNNQIIENIFSTLQSPELDRYYKNITSTKDIKYMKEKIEEITGGQKIHRISGILGKLDGIRNNVIASQLRGVSVLAVTSGAWLSNAKIKLNDAYSIRFNDTVLNSFVNTNEDDLLQKISTGSQNINATVDSPKDPILGIFGLNKQNFGAFCILNQLGMPIKDGSLLIAVQPGVFKANSPTKIQGQLGMFYKFFNSKLKELQGNHASLEEILKYQNMFDAPLSSDDMWFSLRFENNKEENNIDNQMKFWSTQIKALHTMKKAYEIANHQRNISSLITMNRNYGKNFNDAHSRFLQSYDNLTPDPLSQEFKEQPFDASQALESDKNIQTVLNNLRSLLSTARELWIKETDFYHENIENLKKFLDIKPWDIQEKENRLRNSFITYIEVQAHKMLNPSMDFKSLILKQEGKELSTETFQRLLKNRKFRENFFVKHLKSYNPGEKGNPTGFYKLGLDSDTQYSKKTNELLIDSISELADITPIYVSTKLSEKEKNRIQGENDLIPEIKKFIQNTLMNYLTTVHNLEFSNGSFVNLIPSTQFRKISKVLREINSELASSNPNWNILEKLIGKNKDQIKQEFVLNYVLNKANLEDIPKINLKDAKNKENIFYTVQKVDNNLSISLSPEINKKIDLKNNEMFEVQTLKDKTLLVNFPKYIVLGSVYIDSYTGEKNDSRKLYFLVNSTKTSANYKLQPVFELKGMQPWLFTPRENLELSTELSTQNKKNKKNTDDFNQSENKEDNSEYISFKEFFNEDNDIESSELPELPDCV